MVITQNEEVIRRSVKRSTCFTVSTTAKVWVLCNAECLRYSLLPPKMRVSAAVSVRTELVQARTNVEGSEASRKWLVDPGI